MVPGGGSMGGGGPPSTGGSGMPGPIRMGSSHHLRPPTPQSGSVGLGGKLTPGGHGRGGRGVPSGNCGGSGPVVG